MRYTIGSIKHIIEEYAKGKTYFSIDELKRYLKSKYVDFTDETVKKYLYNIKHASHIHSAGRGWYSSLGESFQLDKKPIRSLVNGISRQFPLLSFSCWSTEQLKSYFRHLPAIFAIFVFSERDYLSTLFETLRKTEYHVFLDPTKIESRKSFVVEENTLILRPSISREPSDGKYATIEKILVDLSIESAKLALLGNSEYVNIFQEIVDRYRINIPMLLEYAGRRNIRDTMEKMFIH